MHVVNKSTACCIFQLGPDLKEILKQVIDIHYRFNFKLCFWILVKELPLGMERDETFKMAHIWDWWLNMDNFFIEGHLLRVPDTADVKQKNKNHETIPSRIFPEQKTKTSFDPL